MGEHVNRIQAEKIFSQIKNKFNIENFQFDIFMIKELAKTNTLHDSNSNQTHIAITGEQMDVFPYLENYGHLVEGHKDFKKRFLLRIPVILSKNNLKYLNGEIIEPKDSKDSFIKTFTHFNRSKRIDGFQGELSYLNGEDDNFLTRFRKKINPDDYLIVVKKKEKFEYLFIGLKKSDAEEIIKNVSEEISDEQERRKFLKTISSTQYFDEVNPGTGKNVTPISEKNIDEILENQTFDSNEIIEGFIEWMIDIKKLAFRSVENYSKRYFPKIAVEVVENNLVKNISEFYFGNSHFLQKVKEKYFSIEEINEKNKRYNNSFSATFGNFIEFKKYTESKGKNEIKEPNSYFFVSINKPHQRIVYGAPGTGKSYILSQEIVENFPSFEREMAVLDSKNSDIKVLEKRKEIINTTERVTFYDGYTHGQFVGAYKPVPVGDETGTEELDITYTYVAGPLFRQLVKALNNPNKNFVLVIEEINRARADRVFGNVFQLLDRDNLGDSEYPISLSEEQEKYLKDNLDGDTYNKTIEAKGGLYLPSNLYIWCTMNSADQGVYPMDSAFKRRWDFEYIGLNENDNSFGKEDCKYYLKISNDKNVEWNIFRTVINENLISLNIPEDRLLAPFFIKEKNFKQIESEPNKFILEKNVYESKILMYLFDDILRHRGRNKIFSEEINSFSKLIEKNNSKNSLKDELKSTIFNSKILEDIATKQEELKTKQAPNEQEINTLEEA